MAMGSVLKARHFQQYFKYSVAVSFIGEGNWNTRRKPPTCRNSRTLSHNVVSSTSRYKRDSNSQEEFEDTKGVSRRTDNTMTKSTNNDLQNLHIKLKIEQHKPH
jgi:hypothetical protein